MMKLDRFDRLLLNHMQEDSTQTAEQMAETIPLSPSAIQRRIKRMREEGVIARECVLIDPSKVTRPTFFVVALQVERERPELLAQLRKWLTHEPHIQQVFYVTGEADFILAVTATDTESYDELMSRLVCENANVRRFTTNVALSVVKRGLAIPLDVDVD